NASSPATDDAPEPRSEVAPFDPCHPPPAAIAEGREGDDPRVVDAVDLVAVGCREGGVQDARSESLVGERVQRALLRQDGSVAVDQVDATRDTEAHRRFLLAPPLGVDRAART